MTELEMIRKFDLFNCFSDAEIVGFLPLLNPKRVSLLHGQEIVRCGETADRIFLIETHRLSARYVTARNICFVPEQFVPGDTVGLYSVCSEKKVYPVTLVSSGDCTMIQVSCGAVIPDLLPPEEKDRLRQKSNQAIDGLFWRLVNMSDSARTKVMNYFLLMQDTRGEQFQIPMTFPLLAEKLNIGKSTLMKELSLLQSVGAIQLERANRRVLIHFEALIKRYLQISSSSECVPSREDDITFSF